MDVAILQNDHVKFYFILYLCSLFLLHICIYIFRTLIVLAKSGINPLYHTVTYQIERGIKRLVEKVYMELFLNLSDL